MTSSSLRYARQIALAHWGLEGQQKLHRASVLIVGLGGLGAPVVTYLAGAGVGALTLNDFDRVDLSNLPRQPIHDGGGLGQPKTLSAARTVARLNPEVQVTAIDQRLSATQMTRAVRGHDVVVDASDNFATRFTINSACVRESVALVSVAAIRAEGQLAVFRADLDRHAVLRLPLQQQRRSGRRLHGPGRHDAPGRGDRQPRGAGGRETAPGAA